MMLFYSEKSLGLDIRDDSVAMTVLAKNLGGFKIVASQALELPPRKNSTEQETSLITGISNFLVDLKGTINSVVLSLPRKFITIQIFELPAPDRESIDSMMEFELTRQFASDVEDLSISYHVAEISNNRYKITAAAIKKETLDYYRTVLNRLDLKPEVIDVAVFSNLNILPAPSKTGVEVVIDVRSTHFEITLLQNGEIATTRNIPITDEAITKNYFQTKPSAGSPAKLATSFSKLIVEGLQSTFGSCNSIGEQETLSRIYLMGGGRFSAALASQIKKLTEVPTELIRPAGSMKKNQVFDLAAITSYGLALRPLESNPYKFDLSPKSLSRKKNTPASRTMALGLAVVFLMIAVGMSKVVVDQRTLSSLDQQLAELKLQAETLSQVDQEYQSLEKYTEILNEIDIQSPLKLPILKTLSQILPEDTWLSRISIKHNKVEIQGYSESASTLLPLIENSNFFKNTAFDGSIVKTRKGEKFSLRSQMRAAQ